MVAEAISPEPGRWSCSELEKPPRRRTACLLQGQPSLAPLHPAGPAERGRTIRSSSLGILLVDRAPSSYTFLPSPSLPPFAIHPSGQCIVSGTWMFLTAGLAKLASIFSPLRQ